MVTAKKVIWAESAKKDLYNIYTRLAGKSIERAKDTINGILAATEELNSKYPQGVPEQLLKAETDPYKFITVGFYKIVYSIVEDTVVVETLYHVRQDPVVG
jgi:plasmid stabilization system protein ParE